MPRLTVPLLASLLITLVLQAQGPTSSSTRAITGSVSDARDNAALRRARIALLVDGSQIDTVFTDDDGLFAFPSAPVGAITVRVTKAGYASAETAIPAGRLPAEQRFALPRTAAVMGRLVDLSGSPVAYAYITARARTAGGTSPASSPGLFTRADRLGEYRLSGLAPGRYEIAGVRIPPGQPVPANRLEDVLSGARDRLDIGQPVSLELSSGAEAHGVDFVIPGETEICATGPSVRPPSGAPAGRIEGRVTSSAGLPIACAVVRLLPASPVPQVYTDRQGRYAIDGLPEGTYVVSARKTGYLPMRHGQRAPLEEDSPVIARAGIVRRNVDIQMPRESVVTGTVVDEHGEPVEGVQVGAMLAPRSGGQWQAAIMTVGQPSDDRGYFRVIGLTPGTYVFRTMARGNVGAPDRPLAYVPSYSPSGTDVVLAQRITVEAGRDGSGADIVISPVFTADVAGFALDAAGRPFAGSLSLSASLRSGAPLLETRMTKTDATGAFVFRNVPRGDYVVRAPGPPYEGTARALRSVTIEDSPPAPITLVLREGARLEGRIVFETSQDTNLAGVTLSFSPAASDLVPTGSSRLQFGPEPDGTFRMSGLVGLGHITLGGPPPACDSCYLKSARINGRDAVDAPFDFGFEGGVYRDAEVVVSDAGGTIEGRVIDQRSGGISTVLALSAHEVLRYPGSRYLKAGRLSPDGSFRIVGLPPGDYLVAAVILADASSRAMPTADPDVIDAVATRGTRVTIAERERRAVALRLIQR